MAKAASWLDTDAEVRKRGDVITSYSIHYTKLYEDCSKAVSAVAARQVSTTLFRTVFFGGYPVGERTLV